MTGRTTVHQASHIFELDLNKILVVDDMAENLSLLKLIFRKTEFEVIVASNAYEGLTRAREEYPFLILSDIQMPGMDGYTFCEQLKTDERTKQISIILITSHSHTGAQVSRGLDIGADDFITRPIEAAELLSRVRTVVRLKHAELAAQREAIKTIQKNQELVRINALIEQEVTQRTRELLHEKTKVEAILRGMANGVLVIDTQRRVQTINDAASKILSVSMDILGKSVDDSAFNSQLWRAVQTVVHNNTNSSLFVRNIRPDNSLQAVRIHITQITIEGGIEGWAVVLSDISSIVEAEEMKVRFMTGVTHELKTPLSIIQLHTNNMIRYHERLSIEKQMTLLNGIHVQTDRLSKLIDDVLILARVGNNKKNIGEKRASLTEAIEQALIKVSALAADKKIEIVWHPDSTVDMTPIAIDPQNLILIISNLLENGIKYTMSHGSITITTQKITRNMQPLLRFSVTDTGIGISPADQKHIFDRFFRADRTHAVPGTGLGLAIVKEIVRAHKGDIKVTGELNKGSTFTVTLPLFKAN